jgi:hypothetical protein
MTCICKQISECLPAIVNTVEIKVRSRLYIHGAYSLVEEIDVKRINMNNVKSSPD